MGWILRYSLLLAIGVVFAGITGCAKTSFRSFLPWDHSKSITSLETADSAPITIWFDSFDAAMRESAKTGKPVLASFTGSDWCHYCIDLDKHVFSTDSFQQWAHDHVVLLKVDFPRRSHQTAELKRQNKELAARYHVHGYPTILFLDSEGEVLGKMGYQKNPAEWIKNASTQLGD